MKKLLTLVLCLTLCALPMLGVAEAAIYDDYETAVDPAGLYTFFYPSAYTLLDKDTIGTLMDSIGTDTDIGKVIEQNRDAIENSNMVMLMSADMTSNINIIAQDVGMSLTPEQLLASADSFVAQLKSSLPGLEITEQPSILDSDETFKPMVLGYKYDANGNTINGYQGYFSLNTMFFCVTITGVNLTGQAAQDFGFVMGSITLQ